MKNFIKTCGINCGRLAILAIIIAFGFVFVSCEDEVPRDELFESHSNRSITVSNASPVDLVAYKGSLNKSNRIGGIKARSHNHGLPNDKRFFPNEPTHFQMIFITRAQYEKNKDSPEVLENEVYTRTYVFWNGSAGDNSKVYEISDKVGGIHKIQIWSSSNYDVEFRERGVAGPTLGYVPSGMSLGYLYVNAGDYMLFPVFQKFNVHRNIMESVIPYRPAEMIGTTQFPERPFSYTINISSSATKAQIVAINLNSAATYLSKTKAGVVYVNIVNNFGDGIYAQRGIYPLTTYEGDQVINNSENRSFTILLPNVPGTNNFASSVRTTFEIVAQTIPVPVTAVHDPLITEFDLFADYMYTINVSAATGATIELRRDGDYQHKPIPFEPETNVSVNYTPTPASVQMIVD